MVVVVDVVLRRGRLASGLVRLQRMARRVRALLLALLRLRWWRVSLAVMVLVNDARGTRVMQVLRRLLTLLVVNLGLHRGKTHISKTSTCE
jgi:hypothetical protein